MKPNKRKQTEPVDIDQNLRSFLKDRQHDTLC